MAAAGCMMGQDHQPATKTREDAKHETAAATLDRPQTQDSSGLQLGGAVAAWPDARG